MSWLVPGSARAAGHGSATPKWSAWRSPKSCWARSERHWLRFVHARLGHLFPYLLGQSGYNKRLRAAAHLVVLALRDLAVRSPSWSDGFRLLDAPWPRARSSWPTRASPAATSTTTSASWARG